MMRHRLLGPVRFTLVIALLGALLVTTAGVVSAAAATIIFTPSAPGTGGTRVPGTTNSWYIPLASSTANVNVDCGSATGACSVWATKNNLTTETLFTNVTGNRSNIPFPFINDGCINLRLYDAGHTQLLDQLNVGHGLGTVGGTIAVCDGAGAGSPLLVVNNVTGSSELDFSNGLSSTPPADPTNVKFDSGNAGGIDEAEIWIGQSQPGFAITNCAAVAYPNPSEVLFTRNVAGSLTGPTLTGGGPYCFAMYQGSTHTTKIGGPVQIIVGQFLQYVGGTPNVGGFNPSQGTIYYNGGNGATNALICVAGPSTGGSVVPFSFNSLGFDHKFASFQTAGAGQNYYALRTGVGALDGGGNATPASCGTGTQVTQIVIFT